MFDLFTFKATTEELKITLKDRKINKIYQPSPRDVIIFFNHPANQGALLISCDPAMARFHITNHKYKFPEIPSSFCMLLRKYLEGARIVSIFQVPGERILTLNLIIGNSRYVLVGEIMGRNSNLILLDNKNVILGAMRNITPSMSTHRLIYPGKEYQPPPYQKKISPEDLVPDSFRKILLDEKLTDIPWEKKLLKTIKGIGPLQAKEMVSRAEKEISCGNNPEAVDKMWIVFKELMEKFEKGIFNPHIIDTEKGKQIYAVTELLVFSKLKRKIFTDTNLMLDFYYTNKTTFEKINVLRSSLIIIAEKELKKVMNKENNQKEDLIKAEEAEKYRYYGEIILANLKLIRGKSNMVNLPNIYSPEMEEVSVPLDPRFSAIDNAQRYFKRYRKLQKGKKITAKRLPATIRERKYLESVLYSLENADLPQLDQIRFELTGSGYIKKQTLNKREKITAPPESKFLNINSSKGYKILIGLNNLQNDELTFKKSSRQDIWLHVQKIPGSHVIITGSPFPPDEITLTEAASLAAHFSKAAKLPTVTVDYTQVKNVKRSPGNKPGMANYKDFKSIIVSPEHALSLLKEKY